MPIIIRKSNGDVKLSKPVAPPVEGIDAFRHRLVSLEDADWGPATDARLAFHLGLGTEQARAHLARGEFVATEWQSAVPWLRHLRAAQEALPPLATWELHRVRAEGGLCGWATVQIGHEQYGHHAATPWGAFGLCLLEAHASGILAAGPPA